MAVNRETKYGGIAISNEVIAQVAGEALSECYGVVGLASRNSLIDNVYELLKKEEFTKGVKCTSSKKGYEVDIYVVVAYGVKITEVASEIQKRVKYVLEKNFSVDFAAINVYIQDVKEV